MVAALRSAFSRVSLLAPRAGGVLVGTGPSEIDELLPWDGPELAAILAGEATGGPLDAALRRVDVVLAYTRSESLVLALRERCGRVLRHDPSPPSAGPHASLWLAQPLSALGLALPDRPARDADDDARAPEPPDLSFTPAEHVAARAWLAALPTRFLAVHPGSAAATKCWPAEGFAAVAARLAGASRFLVVLGPAEPHQAWQHAHGAVVARELPLRTLGAVLSRAGLFVGNDSGIGHLAAACGVPALVLFGPTDPAVWAPVGRAVRWLRPPDGSLAALSVDAVAREAAALLAHVNGERTSTRLISR